MNTEKIIRLVLAINEKMNLLYDKIQILKQDFDRGYAKGLEIYKEYIIEGSLLYEPSFALPQVSEEMMDSFAKFSMGGKRNIYASHEKMESRQNQLYLGEGVNWNTDFFDRPELKEINVCHYAHSFFFQSKTYSLQDMLFINSDDFKLHIEAYFDPS